jgi:hypothetical protein
MTISALEILLQAGKATVVPQEELSMRQENNRLARKQDKE